MNEMRPDFTSTEKEVISKLQPHTMPHTKPGEDQETKPLISVLMFVRNGLPHMRRAVHSVLSQSYDNIEFVIQDAASTDGTVAFLNNLDDPRIKLVSEPDDGPADGFARALNRCKGDIIATCLADEELVPGALERVVALFRKHPHLGAITGDAHITDIDGNINSRFVGAPFNLVTYLWGEYCPYWCSSFFKREALAFVGLFDTRWSRSSLELEVWCRLAIETDILYVPEIFSKYAFHEHQLSQNPTRIEEELEARFNIIRNHLFGPGTFFGDDPFKRDVVCLLQLRNLYRHLSAWRPADAEQILEKIIDTGLLAHFNASRPDSEVSTEAVSGEEADAFLGLPAEYAIYSTVASPLVRPSGGDSYLIKRGTVLGSIYRGLTPTMFRAAIPQSTKEMIAKICGLKRS